MYVFLHCVQISTVKLAAQQDCGHRGPLLVACSRQHWPDAALNIGVNMFFSAKHTLQICKHCYKPNNEQNKHKCKKRFAYVQKGAVHIALDTSAPPVTAVAAAPRPLF